MILPLRTVTTHAIGESLFDPAPPASDSAAAKDDDVAADRFDVIGVGARGFVPDVGYLSDVGTYFGVAVIAAALDRVPVSGRNRT